MSKKINKKQIELARLEVLKASTLKDILEKLNNFSKKIKE